MKLLIPRRRIPEKWRKEYLKKRPPAKVRKDLVEAFDRIEGLKAQLYAALLLLAVSGVTWLAQHLIEKLK